MSITSKSQTENSEEYLNKLLSLSNDDFIKLSKKQICDEDSKHVDTEDSK